MRRIDRRFGVVSERTKKNMRRIHSKDTSIEVNLRKKLWAVGLRYRKNFKSLPGSPDIAITKYKVAIFCDSEFFHGKNWELLRQRLEKGKNPNYWILHIEENMLRDKRVNEALGLQGWTVLRFWGREIEKQPDSCVKAIIDVVHKKMMCQRTG